VRSQPVVLVHGFASSFERNWRKPGWVDLLADAGREVIPVDLLGHGTAPKPHDAAAYADLEARVAEVLPQGEVDAIGFSLGARVLLTLAAERPQRFARLVVGGVGANLFREEAAGAVADAIEGKTATEHPLAQAFARFAQTQGNDPAALAACLRRPSMPMTADQLGNVTCPVLVVLGDRDEMGPADPLLEALPDATFVSLRGIDHLATPGNFGFVDAALEFLDAVPA
jgi:pimeloyl-ACP methyl ester carboxylesterase